MGFSSSFLAMVFSLYFVVSSGISSPDEQIISSKEAKEDLKKLRGFFSKNPEAKELLSDIEATLVAISEKNSATKWAEAFKDIHEKNLQELALKNWHSQQTSKSNFLNTYKSIAKIAPEGSYLRKLISLSSTKQEKALVKLFHQVGKQDSKNFLTQTDITSADGKKFVQEINLTCFSHSKLSVAAIDAELHALARLLVAICQKETWKLDKTLSMLPEKISEKPQTIAYTIPILKFLAQYFRTHALRKEATDVYAALGNLWLSKSYTAKSIGMGSVDFVEAKVDDLLWSARYRAMVGDYTLAENFLKDAHESIDSLNLKKLSKHEREDIISLTAEILFVKAHRIEIERKDFKRVFATLEEALAVPGVSKEWQKSILWHEGLYAYMMEDYGKAIEYWESLDEKNPKEEVREKLYFWLAQAYDNSGLTESGGKLRAKLNKEFPYGFYSVESLERTKAKRGKFYAASKEDPGKNFLSQAYTELPHLGLNDEDANDVKRSLYLLSAGLPLWAKTTAQALPSQLLENHSIGEHKALFLFLAKLLYSTKNFRQGIALSETIREVHPGIFNEHPELMRVFFPDPYSGIYQLEAEKNAIPQPMLLSITRQESLFNSYARSQANAIGLMQLIPPTAEALAQESHLEIKDSEEALYNPKTNIALGSYYLKKLSEHYHQFEPAVYAAYNAGEFAVDAWLARRGNPDPALWIEMIPFSETKKYVQEVWRNHRVYSEVLSGSQLIQN